jgi:hypothetical protein
LPLPLPLLPPGDGYCRHYRCQLAHVIKPAPAICAAKIDAIIVNHYLLHMLRQDCRYYLLPLFRYRSTRSSAKRCYLPLSKRYDRHDAADQPLHQTQHCDYAQEFAPPLLLLPPRLPLHRDSAVKTTNAIVKHAMMLRYYFSHAIIGCQDGATFAPHKLLATNQDGDR